MSVGKRIAIIMVLGIIAVAVKFGVTSYTMKTQQENENDFNVKASEFGFLFNYRLANTDMVQSFCTPTGYVPNKYIADFTAAFAPYQNKINELEKNQKIANFKSGLTEIAMQQSKVVMNQEFEAYKAEFARKNINFTVTDYCKLYDFAATDIIKSKMKFLQETNIMELIKNNKKQMTPQEKEMVEKALKKTYDKENQ